MNIHAATAYAGHLLRARSTAGHGVHSPLMFRFITEVIGGRADKHIINEVRSLRREMLSDGRVVRVTDLGAGSALMGSNERTISRIASVAALPSREVALLIRIAASLDSILERAPEQQAGGSRAHKMPAGDSQASGRITGDVRDTGSLEKELPVTDLIACDPHLSVHPGDNHPKSHFQITSQPGDDRQANYLHADFGQEAGSPARGGGSGDNNQTIESSLADPLRPERESNHHVILELGTSLGISTLALALGAPHRRVITVEGCPELAAIASENLLRHGASNAEVLNMEFNQALSHLKSIGTKVEMAFIDGNHRGDALTDYTNRIMEMGDQMIIVADDIHMNRDMHQAWHALVASSSAIVSLETFRLGILFCLHNLTPGRYRIRY